MQISTKQCTLCKQEKPKTEFYRTPPSQKSKDGFRWQCKTCHTHNFANKDPETRHEYSRRYYLKNRQEKPAYYLLRNVKARAKQLGYDFNLTLEDIIIPEVCPYFTKPFILVDDKWAPSIDRIDSTKGYIKGNIQVISKIANWMKRDTSIEDLVTFARGVLRHHVQGG